MYGQFHYTEPLFETELLPHQTTDSVEFFQIYVQFVIRICLAAQPVKSIFQLNKFCPGGLEIRDCTEHRVNTQWDRNSCNADLVIIHEKLASHRYRWQRVTECKPKSLKFCNAVLNTDSEIICRKFKVYMLSVIGVCIDTYVIRQVF